MSIDSLLSQAAEVVRRSTVALVVLGNATVAPLSTLSPLMEDPRGSGWGTAVERWSAEAQVTRRPRMDPAAAEDDPSIPAELRVLRRWMTQFWTDPGQGQGVGSSGSDAKKGGPSSGGSGVGLPGGRDSSPAPSGGGAASESGAKKKKFNSVPYRSVSEGWRRTQESRDGRWDPLRDAGIELEGVNDLEPCGDGACDDCNARSRDVPPGHVFMLTSRHDAFPEVIGMAPRSMYKVYGSIHEWQCSKPCRSTVFHLPGTRRATAAAADTNDHGDDEHLHHGALGEYVTPGNPWSVNGTAAVSNHIGAGSTATNSIDQGKQITAGDVELSEGSSSTASGGDPSSSGSGDQDPSNNEKNNNNNNNDENDGDIGDDARQQRMRLKKDDGRGDSKGRGRSRGKNGGMDHRSKTHDGRRGRQGAVASGQRKNNRGDDGDRTPSPPPPSTLKGNARPTEIPPPALIRSPPRHVTMSITGEGSEDVVGLVSGGTKSKKRSQRGERRHRKNESSTTRANPAPASSKRSTSPSRTVGGAVRSLPSLESVATAAGEDPLQGVEILDTGAGHGQGNYRSNGSGGGYPTCPYCGSMARPNVRHGPGDERWVTNGRGWLDYLRWRVLAENVSRRDPHRLVIIEIDVPGKDHNLRSQSEAVLNDMHKFGAFMVRISAENATNPSNPMQTIPINLMGKEALERLDALIRKRTEGSKDKDKQ